MSAIGIRTIGEQKLEELVTGKVYRPGEDGYEEGKATWNVAISQEPAVIVLPRNVDDVQAAVRWASENNLPVAVQATGHGVPRGCDGGMLINMREITHVSIDLSNRTARIGGGAQWLHVLPAAYEAGLAPLCGSAPHVGVVGYTIGGGYSIMGRKYGLAIDSVRSFQIVTADGEVRTASATENADLFWAVRGGGGGFGVIIEIEMTLYPQPEIYGGSILYPIDRAAEVLEAFREFTRTAPDDVSATFQLMHFPPVPFVPEFLHNQSVVMIIAAVTQPEAEAVELLKPLRNLGGEIVDMFQTMPFTHAGEVFKDPVDPLPAVGNGVLLEKLDAEVSERLLASIGDMAQSPNIMVQLRHLGGAMNTQVGSGCCRREANYLLYMLGVPHAMNAPEAIAEQSERVFSDIEKYVLARGPLNFLGEGHVPSSKIRSLFRDEEFEKLMAVKYRFDPNNVFAFAGVGISE